MGIDRLLSLCSSCLIHRFVLVRTFTIILRVKRDIICTSFKTVLRDIDSVNNVAFAEFSKMRGIKIYDFCIVGGGMIGSAAARHVTRTTNLKVCLIGPSEPKVRTSENTRDIYGSYYDEGRITRCTDKDPVWAKLAQESIKRYRDIEHQSGVRFYHEGGNLMIGPKDSNFIRETEKVISDGGIEVEHMDNQKLCQTFRYLNFSTDTVGLKEFKNAGYINPRKLVEAQQLLARKQGCAIFDDVVNHVTRIVQSDGSYAIKVETESGHVFHTKAVLLATGAFTEFRDLLSGLCPDQVVTPQSTTYMEVNRNDLQKLRDMPCIIYRGAADKKWRVPLSQQSRKEIRFYMLPPIKYPDGRYYIKLGISHSVPGHLTSAAGIKRWFDNGDPQTEEAVAKFTASLFKGIDFLSWRGDCCTMEETPTERPYIDKVHAQLGVAIGGNGYAAKSSDEIGRLAVSMMLGGWDSEIPKDTFKLRVRGNSASPAKAKL